MRRQPRERRPARAAGSGARRERADQLDPAAVVDEQAAALGEQLAAAIGPGEQRRLGERLGLDRGVGRAPWRRSGRSRRARRVAGSSRWWAKRPSVAAPDPHVESRGGDAAGAEREARRRARRSAGARRRPRTGRPARRRRRCGCRRRSRRRSASSRAGARRSGRRRGPCRCRRCRSARPGGRAISPASSSTSKSRQRAAGSGGRAAPARGVRRAPRRAARRRRRRASAT